MTDTLREALEHVELRCAYHESHVTGCPGCEFAKSRAAPAPEEEPHHREVLQLRVPRREALSVAWHLVQVWWSAVRDGSQTVEITFGWDDPA